MVLLVIVGVIATNKNFPAAYSFAKSEAVVSFNFLFDSFRQFVFGDDIAEAQIILADQAAGLITVIPILIPNCLLQHCNWHVSQNIAKRLTEKRYLAEERKEIINYIWWYIQSQTEPELAENRAIIISKIKIFEQDFISKYWKPKETQFVTIYIKTSPNLGCNSTQRAESTYPVTTTLLNHQLSLGEAVRRLSRGIITLL